VVPSNAAGLQLRRRLAQLSAYAAVRFESLPRLAELIAAGHLAAEGKSPLARPIGDYVAGEVALSSGSVFSRVRELPGYARSLRRVFRRLRRGGIMRGAEVPGPRADELSEVLRLYDDFRARTAPFYDEEDLLDAAADVVRRGQAGVGAELGSIFVVAPGALSAGGHALLTALAGRKSTYVEVGENDGPAATKLILAPDPSSEAREVVREVLSALEGGLGVHEVAVFHGAGSGYPRLLREAFEAAGVPSVSIPGIPLSESAIGRAALTLLNLPAQDYARTHTMDLFALNAIKRWVPGGDDGAPTNQPSWDRVSRAAGITRGRGRWGEGLETHARDLEEQLRGNPRVAESESLTRRMTFERDKARELASVIEELLRRLQTLEARRPAADFIAALRPVVDSYLDSGAEGYEDLLREIGQLGTVDAVGGSFDLRSFAEALRANLETGVLRESRVRLGDGVLVADYRMAAGLGFRHVVLCGAYEGALPASPGSEPLVDERIWTSLRETHPFLEDTKVRTARSREAAERAVRCASGGTVVWSCPIYEPGATRDFYPSPMMVQAAMGIDAEVRTATQLRGLPARSWLRRSPSPLGTMLEGRASEAGEVTLRHAVSLRKTAQGPDAAHSLARRVEMLRARRSGRFTEWDGNLSSLSGAAWLAVGSSAGPTTLENYASCGFRYFARSVLKLNAPEEPEEREVMDAAERGTLVHRALERFFRQIKEAGRPWPGEPWEPADRDLLGSILTAELDAARARGRTGREIFSGREAQLLRADLMRFLDMDSEFRAETGAIPSEFEAPLPGVEVGGVALRGSVDRIDRTPDGRKAWIIDYKTGRTKDYEAIAADPLVRGTKLQLPAYLTAVQGAGEVSARYWFITHAGGFKQIEFDVTSENLERFEATIKTIADGVRAGSFPAVSGNADDYYGGWDNCRYCDYTRLCSRRRDHEHAAKLDDEGMLPWLLVATVASPKADPE
jgi:RecB family exonuclease